MSTISSSTAVSDALASRTDNRFSEMSSEDFIRVIFTELSNQDPFQPNDSAALLDQLNSIRSIESDLTLVTQLKSLVTENQLASGAGLIGSTVTGLTDDARRVSGRVIAVARQGDRVLLELESGERLGMGSVEEINAE